MCSNLERTSTSRKMSERAPARFCGMRHMKPLKLGLCGVNRAEHHEPTLQRTYCHRAMTRCWENFSFLYYDSPNEGWYCGGVLMSCACDDDHRGDRQPLVYGTANFNNLPMQHLVFLFCLYYYYALYTQ